MDNNISTHNMQNRPVAHNNNRHNNNPTLISTETGEDKRPSRTVVYYENYGLFILCGNVLVILVIAF